MSYRQFTPALIVISLAFTSVVVSIVPISSHAQRSVRDMNSGSSSKKPCRKVKVMVNGLQRVKCKTAKKKSRPRDASGKTETRRRKQCDSVGGKRNCSWITYFQGHGVAKKKLRQTPLPKPSGKIWVYSNHHKEEFKLNIYDSVGILTDTSLAKLDGGFRCARTKAIRAVDSRLYVILSHIRDKWPGRRVNLVSGFRFQTNEGSRHFHAAAMDIRISGVDAQEIYDFAESLDTGGMGIGIYPYAGFVHIDFRAPGQPSFRWTDISPKNYAERGKEVSSKAKTGKSSKK